MVPTLTAPTLRPATDPQAAVPTLPTHWLPRQRLRDVLRAAVRQRIVLVRGPAGYGKTAMVAQWARSTRQHVAWVSLDPGDDHPDRVAARVAASISQAAPDAGRSTPDRGRTGVVSRLRHAIERSGVTALVLDDLDVLCDPAALDLVRRLVSSMPSGARTIITTRGAPTRLPLARWRWQGDLAEIGAATLAFTLDETARYLRDCWEWSVDAAAAQRLWAHTGGWPAALHLMASCPQPAGSAIPDVDLDQLDAYTTTVLAREHPDDVAWLLRCSVLEVLDPDVCADLVGDDGAERLRRLATRNLVTPGEGGHRLVTLLRDALRQELRTRSRSDARQLWQRAQQVRAEHGDPVGAVTAALHSDDGALALSVLDAHRGAIAAIDGGATLQRLVSALDTQAVAARPALVTTLVDLTAVRRDLPRLHELLDILPRPHDPAAAAASTHAEATLARLTGTGRPGIGTGAAGEDLATLDHLRGVEAGWDGDHARAETLLGRALAAASRRGDAIAQLVVLGDLAWEHARAGRVPVAEVLARRALALSRQLRLDQPPAIVQLAQVSIAIDRGRRAHADAALRQLEQAVEAAADPLLAFELATTRLRIDDAPDATARALRAVARIATTGRHRYGGELARRLARADATLRLQAGVSSDEAAAAAPLLTTGNHRELRPADQLLLARLLLRRGQPARAQTITAEFELKTNGPRLVVAARNLAAAAARAGGDRGAALAARRRARETAMAQSIMRGTVVAAPGTRAVTTAPATRPLRPPPVGGGLRGALRPRGTAPASRRTNERPLVAEPLTERESEVLRLLPSGLRYKDMAAELVVSLNTVKSHLKSVYRKLGASSRYEALDRAYELDLITSAHSTDARPGTTRIAAVTHAPGASGARRSVVSLSPDGA